MRSRNLFLEILNSGCITCQLTVYVYVLPGKNSNSLRKLYSFTCNLSQCVDNTHFFYKNKVYKNTEAQNH